MTYEQTPTLNLNLYPQGKFAERCVGFVDDLARWEEANQLEAVPLKNKIGWRGKRPVRFC